MGLSRRQTVILLLTLTFGAGSFHLFAPLVGVPKSSYLIVDYDRVYVVGPRIHEIYELKRYSNNEWNRFMQFVPDGNDIVLTDQRNGAAATLHVGRTQGFGVAPSWNVDQSKPMFESGISASNTRSEWNFGRGNVSLDVSDLPFTLGAYVYERSFRKKYLLCRTLSGVSSCFKLNGDSVNQVARQLENVQFLSKTKENRSWIEAMLGI